MKHLLVLLFFPAYLSAQDCQLKKYKDQFSQEPKISTGFMRYSSTSMSIDADAKEIDFLFSVGKNSASEKCFDDASTVVFVFEGGRTRANFRNTGTMNCDGLIHITFKNSSTTPSALQRLIDKKITTISLNGTNKSITTVTLSEEQQQALSQRLSCFVEEAKKLIK
jgi:hypothetical protein